MTKEKIPKKKEYRYPAFQRIGGHYKKLYTVERALDDALIVATRELQKTYSDLGAPLEDFWHDAFPQALFDLLDRFETGASVTACLAFLAMQREKGEIS